MGAVDGFRRAVRAALGMPRDPGDPPDLMRLGLYRARVDSCGQDGAAMDVTPDDERIPPAKNVPVRSPLPGAVVVVQTGAYVLIGWERGDPERPYCVPSWESGAQASKIVLPANELYLATENGAKKLATEDHTHQVPYSWTGAPGSSTATAAKPTTGLTILTKAG